MSPHRLLLGLTLTLTATLCAQADTRTVLCGQLVDVENSRLLDRQIITISDDLITDVSAAGEATGDDVDIDLGGQTCLPGLIDMHVHLTIQSSPRAYLERYSLNTADYAYRAVAYAETTLMAGFTSVRNLGDDGTITASLRDAIARGVVVGPRIFTAGKSIATTGGHADPSNALRADLMGDPTAVDGVINGSAEAMKAVRQRYKEGVDLIKITATGGVLSQAKNGQNPQFTQEELDALVAVARDYDLKVAAHAHGAEGMKRAIRAGVASIEHGTLMDDEVIALMKKHGTYLVPTILAGDFVAQKARIDGYFPEMVRPKAAELGPRIQQNFSRAYKAGVRIAFGTDCGVSPHGENAREFTLMTDAGMPAIEAIRTATVHAADLLGQSQLLGAISAGRKADLIAVTGNPLDNIALLESVDFVMKDGQIHKQD